ncbi:MAG TPA: maleylpyruvate isomerase N-terminal domain-containing protein [Pseudonocardia sp.]|jgi:uncharacterized protein (TIGR03083 family)|nr:maleylpyruvate isomerase N-terminal domain-containing protein [Pseudonocardia sp.]
MSEISGRYRTIAEAFTARVDGIRSEQWNAQTPCAEWDARQLLEHVVSVHRMATAGLAGEPPPEAEPGEDLVAA